MLKIKFNKTLTRGGKIYLSLQSKKQRPSFLRKMFVFSDVNKH